MVTIGNSGSTIGQLVRARRERRGWSLGQLEERAGVSKSYLSKIEGGGSRRLGARVAQRLSAILDIPLEMLTGEAASPTAPPEEIQLEDALGREVPDPDVALSLLQIARGYRRGNVRQGELYKTTLGALAKEIQRRQEEG